MDLKKRIVIIEDEVQIAELIISSFPEGEFLVESYGNGSDGFDALKAKKPDLLILDWELPDMSGPDVIRLIRSTKSIKTLPIVMLTIRKETRNITTALDMGADEYITKPFKPRELLSRVNALLRRLALKEPQPEVIKRGCLELYVNDRKALIKGKPVDLTDREYQMLYLLTKRQGKVVSFDEMIERIWGYEYLDGDVIGSKIRVLIQRLKSKIGKQAGDMIVAKYGAGYLFEG